MAAVLCQRDSSQIIAYIDDFKLLMILTLVALPLVLFFLKPPRGAGRDQATPGARTEEATGSTNPTPPFRAKQPE